MRTALAFTMGLVAAALGLGAASLLARDLGRTEADTELVIPAGREREVLALVRAIGPTFATHRVGDVRIEQREIRVALESDRATTRGVGCGGPDWVRAPGALRITYGDARADRAGARSGERSAERVTLAWFLCEGEDDAARIADDDARRAIASVASSIDPSRVWQRASRGGALPTYGLVTPAARALDLTPAVLVVIVWLIGLAVSLAAPRIAGGAAIDALSPSAIDTDAKRAKIVTLATIALVVLGVALRVYFAAAAPQDGDEHWAFPSRHPILSGDHDAWVHPPLFRALADGFGHAIGWTIGDTMIALRAPSLVAAACALALAGVAAASSRSPWSLAPLGVVALSPAIAAESTLARPHGLAALFVTAVALALFVPDSPPATTSRSSNALRFAVALAALGAAMWTDLVAGLVALALVGVRLVSRDVPWRTRAVVAAVSLVWAIALVPGALVAIETQVEPTPIAPGARAPDLGPEQGLGHGDPLAFIGSAATFGVLGGDLGVPLLGLVALAWLVLLALEARRGGRSHAAVAPLVTLAVLALISLRIGMRTRNFVFLPHLVALATALALPALEARLRARSRENG